MVWPWTSKNKDMPLVALGMKKISAIPSGTGDGSKTSEVGAAFLMINSWLSEKQNTSSILNGFHLI